METIIGRNEEKKVLTEALQSGDAELIAVYGRRRIGKTFLIRNHYDKHIRFELTGVHEANLKDQLRNFSLALQSSMAIPITPADPGNWIDAFRLLSDHLKTLLKKEPVVILFDELPWLCTPKSGFLQAFGHWWNTWASRHPLVKVVICGSAASWIIRNIINDRGGLHNRVTQRILLLPFTLAETERFLLHHDVKLDRYQVLQLYMAMGGVPQYLKQVKRGESAAQTIDKLCFTKSGMLKTEFNDLYKSLFAHAESHVAIVRALSKTARGMTRAEIIQACGFTTGGWTTELFDELERSGFITQYIPFDRTVRDAIYKLSDEYSLFYLKFIEGTRATGAGTWLRVSQTQSYSSWSGFAFEAVCQKHVDAIKQSLGIAGVHTEASGWRYTPKNGKTGAQIDLLLDRADHTINLCEIKFSGGEFTIDKKYAGELDNKVTIFKGQTKTRKTIFPTMITTYGTKQNIYYTGRIVSEVTMDELFK
ncbi:MAG: ATP-binding protein [Chitinophagaceae bacterium]